MTKMEETETPGGETNAVVPTTHQTTSPSGKDGGGGARFCGGTSPTIKLEPDAPMSCAGCNEQILDKYYMKVDGKAWHERCVCCAACRQPLADSCFSKNCKLYCKEDYKRLQYCYRCHGPITGEELVMRVGPDSYHVNCFLCDYCNRQLQSGDQFHFMSENEKNKICCKRCYDIDDVANPKGHDSDSEESLNNNDDVFSPGMYPHQPPHLHMQQAQQHYRTLPEFGAGVSHGHHPVVGMGCGKNGKSPSSSSIMTSPGDSKRSKRPRTILTTAQRRKFKASFEISQKPCRKVRETLANETGLTPRVVQVWFQNQRAKMKKIARRQNQGETGSRRGKRKKDDSDSENEVPSSPGSYTSAPTPHQAQFYSDYQSPSSMQTSPTSTQEGSVSGFFPPPPHHHGFNHSEAHYDEYEAASRVGGMMDEQYLHAPPPTSHGMDSPTQMEMHRIMQERAGMHVMQPRDVTHRHDDVTHPHHDDLTHRHEEGVPLPYEHLPPFAQQRPPEAMELSREQPLVNPTSTDGSNPIDSLMFMQTNYFST